MKFDASFINDEQCPEELDQLFEIDMTTSTRDESKCGEFLVHFSTSESCKSFRTELVKDIFREEGHDIAREESHAVPHQFQFELRRARPLCMVYSIDKIDQCRDEKNEIHCFAIFENAKDRTVASSDTPDEAV